MKKDVILINLPPSNNYQYEHAGCIYPATGIMVIGSLLKKKGFSVSLIDGALDPKYEQIVLEKVSDRTAFVGFSTMTPQITMAYELAKKIKEKKSDTFIIFGGVHPTLFPEQTVKNPYIDIVVINEGTKTALELMDYIDGKTELGNIKGIAYCDSKEDVKISHPQAPDEIFEIPHLDFDLLDINRYLSATSVYDRELNHNGDKNLKLMPILSGLGCCFKCAFCINVILGRRYRTRSAESIVGEMKRLQSSYGANAFLFLDEDFCIDKKRLAKFIQLVKDENIKFAGRIWSRVSYFKQDSFKKLVPEMEQIGIRSIAMGAESGSSRILDYLCKDIDPDDVVCAANELSKFDITSRVSFMVGFDGESKQETIASYKLCADLFRINPRTDIAGPFVFRYYPGSPIFNQMVKKYNLKVPQAITEWEGTLNDDGSLIVDTQQWTWPGFLKYTSSMCKYISLYTFLLNKPAYRNNFFIKIIKKLILWRLSNGEHFYSLDYYLIMFLKKIKKSISKLPFITKFFRRERSK